MANSLVRIVVWPLSFISIIGLVQAPRGLGRSGQAVQNHFSSQALQSIRQQLGWTAEQIQRATPGELMRLHEAMEEGESIRDREEFEGIHSRSENGQPSDEVCLSAKVQALQSWKSTGNRAQVVAGISTGLPAISYSPLRRKQANHRWQSIGPTNVPGRTRAIAFLNKDPNQLLVGSVSGGLWRSNNGGRTFQPVDDFLANLAISCIAVHPSKANIILAGTGEGYGNYDAMTGNGIYETTDGTHWRHLKETEKGRFEFINRIAFSPDGKSVLVATQPRTLNGHQGIYRSTVPMDGQSWNWVQESAEDTACVQFDPKDSTKAIASSITSGAAYYSSDSGTTWTKAMHPMTWSGEVEVTYASADSNVVYASVSSTTSTPEAMATNPKNKIDQGAIWKSTDGGKSYALQANAIGNDSYGGYLGTLGWYCNTIWAGDPSDPNLVLVGGFELWRSTDSGNHLTNITSILEDSSIHCDQHIVVSDPKYDGKQNRSVYVGNDGGIAKTLDIRSVYFNRPSTIMTLWIKPGAGYGSTQFYGAAYSPTLDKVLGGTQDNGTLVYDLKSSSGVWDFYALGDGGYCAADPHSKLLYGEQEFGNIMRSSNGGTYSMYISGQYRDRSTGKWVWRSPPHVIQDAQNKHIGFVAPFILDPNNSRRLLVGGFSIWQTNNPDAPLEPGPTWSSIGPSRNQSPISAIAVQPGNSAVTWVGYQDGSLFRSTNSTSPYPTWQIVASPSGVRSRMCTRIVFDPSLPGSVLIGFGGFASSNLWRCSRNGTWTNLSLGKRPLPNAPVDAVAVHPSHPNWLYVGTDVGLYASQDGGANWWSAGPDTCRVNDLVWAGEKLILVSHGRGMFLLDLSSL